MNPSLSRARLLNLALNIFFGHVGAARTGRRRHGSGRRRRIGSVGLQRATGGLGSGGSGGGWTKQAAREIPLVPNMQPSCVVAGGETNKVEREKETRVGSGDWGVVERKGGEKKGA